VNAPAHAEHIVLVEFRGLELVFVFSSTDIAKVFLECMEMLIRRAHEKLEDHLNYELKPSVLDLGASDRSIFEQSRMKAPLFDQPTFHF